MIQNFAEHISEDRTEMPRILLADSNLRMRSYTRRLLESHYDVLAVGDGETALRALHDWHPDLVVCDMATPKVTGMELLQKLRDTPETQTTPFILLSEHSNDSSWLQGIEAGADDYIAKPFNDYELMARINGLLRLKEMRKEAQSREVELKAETTSVLESIDEAFIAVDSDWNITYMNAEAEKIYSASRETLLGKNLWEAYPEAIGTNFYKEYQMAMSERIPTKFVEFYKPYQTWFEVNVCPVASGGLAIYFQDVSARKRTDIIIEGQKRALELAIKDAPVNKIFDVIARTVEKQSGNMVMASIMILDEDKKHLRLGAAPSLPEEYKKAIDGMEIGISAGSCGTVAFTGKPIIVSDIASDPLWTEFRDTALKHGLEACWSNPIYSSSGQVLGTFAIYFSKMIDPMEQDWSVVEFLSQTVAIIIERKNEFYERKLAEKALKEADRRKDEFLATLAHELRNPLAPISNALHIMRMPNVPRNVMEMSEGIMERQLAQMVRLVDDLMDVSRISRGKINLQKEKIVLADVINSALETASSLIEDNSHTISVSLPEEDVWLEGDFTRLAQIFSNILTNSIKYTDPGGKIHVSATRSNNDIVVEITDNGIGIAADQIPHIFDIFAQVDSAIDRARGGLGIGLTLVKNLVELHGGTVAVRSEGLGKGSTFSVGLPIIREPENFQGTTLEYSRQEAAHGLKVMIVDDNEEAAQTSGWMMEFLGYQTLVVHSGKEALRQAQSFIPDVVMLDIGLPEMNGYDVCRLLHAMPEMQNTIFIAQTGWGQAEHRRKAEEAGFDHYLVKPVDMSVLEDLLGRVVLHRT